MKYLKVVVTTLLLLTPVVPVSTHAGEITEWLRAAAYVYVRHEVGHQDRAMSNGAEYKWSYAGEIGLVPDIEIKYRMVPNDESTIKWAADVLSMQSPDTVEKSAFLTDVANMYRKDMLAINEVKRVRSSIAGGGFSTQQSAVEELPSGEFKRKAIILSATIKAGYVPYHFIKPTGDIVRMSASNTVPLISGALLLSSAVDIWRATKPTEPAWRIDFLSVERSGAVGIMYASTF